ncbi:MAG TPA: ComEC/Rec2 family competence protein, partial [Candidatus Kapabacteria bacterium]
MIEELFRGRPAVLAALALGLGIAFEPVCGLWFAFALALLVLVLSLVWQRKGTYVLWLFAFFCLVGSALVREDVESYSNSSLARIASLKLEKVILVGTIIETNESNSDYLWTFHTDSIGIPNEQAIPTGGNVLLYIPKLGYSHVPLPEAGSLLRIYSALEPFHRPTNPHEFGSDLKLQTTTHTEAVGYVHSRFDYTVVHAAIPSFLTQLSSLLASMHAKLLSLLDRSMEQPDARGFVEAVVLGDRSNMDKETLNDFTTAGVAHILAVSGFNVAIVSLVVAQLL